MSRKNYAVLVPFPTGGGHYAAKGSIVELMDVQARALVQAGRIELVADIAAVSAAPKKSTAKAE